MEGEHQMCQQSLELQYCQLRRCSFLPLSWD